jgi:hypothetical protein
MLVWNSGNFLPRNFFIRLEIPDDGHQWANSRESSNDTLAITMEQGSFVLWVEEHNKPRLVVTRATGAVVTVGSEINLQAAVNT